LQIVGGGIAQVVAIHRDHAKAIRQDSHFDVANLVAMCVSRHQTSPHAKRPPKLGGLSFFFNPSFYSVAFHITGIMCRSLVDDAFISSGGRFPAHQHRLSGKIPRVSYGLGRACA
jgi:hypothetical protein